MNFDEVESMRQEVLNSLAKSELTSGLGTILKSDFHSRVEKTLQNDIASSTLGVGIGLNTDIGYRLEFRALTNPAEKLASQIVSGLAREESVKYRILRVLPGTFSVGRSTASALALREGLRPPVIGSAIGSTEHELLGYGSLGAFFELNQKEVGFLTCSHVALGFGEGRLGDTVSQPAPCLVDSPDVEHVIGEVVNGNRVSSNKEAGRWNKTDAAMVRADARLNPYSWQNVLPDKESRIGQILVNDGFPEEIAGEEIIYYRPEILRNEKFLRSCLFFKIGAGTGFTKGKLEGFRVLGSLRRQGPRYAEHYHFQDVFEIGGDKNNPFSAGGDSGALVCAQHRESSEVMAIGLIIGEADTVPPNTSTKHRSEKQITFSYVTPLDTVLKHFTGTNNAVRWKED